MSKKASKQHKKSSTKHQLEADVPIVVLRRGEKISKREVERVLTLMEARKRIHDYFSEIAKKSWKVRRANILTRSLNKR